jgi:hypothetical protein
MRHFPTFQLSNIIQYFWKVNKSCTNTQKHKLVFVLCLLALRLSQLSIWKLLGTWEVNIKTGENTNERTRM